MRLCLHDSPPRNSDSQPPTLPPDRVTIAGDLFVGSNQITGSNGGSLSISQIRTQLFGSSTISTTSSSMASAARWATRGAGAAVADPPAVRCLSLARYARFHAL